MKFVDNLNRWVGTVVFHGSYSVLVNDSAIWDFSLGKEIHYVLFLVLVMEGLNGIMKKAVTERVFRGVEVEEEVSFNILQFPDDTILMGGGCWSNLWCIKSILRSFELVSRLKVNFFKSKLYGVNLNTGFLQSTSFFLNCFIDFLPFKFLRVLLGAFLGE